MALPPADTQFLHQKGYDMDPFDIPAKIYDLARDALKHGQSARDAAKNAEDSINQAYVAVNHSSAKSYLDAVHAIFDIGSADRSNVLELMKKSKKITDRIGSSEDIQCRLANAQNAAQKARAAADLATKQSVVALSSAVRVGYHVEGQASIVESEQELLSSLEESLKIILDSPKVADSAICATLTKICISLLSKLGTKEQRSRERKTDRSSGALKGDVPHPRWALQEIELAFRDAKKYSQQADQAAAEAKEHSGHALIYAGLTTTGDGDEPAEADGAGVKTENAADAS